MGITRQLNNYILGYPRQLMLIDVQGGFRLVKDAILVPVGY